MNVSELLARYAIGERDFSGFNLSQANLSCADLSQANLSCADLSQANLSCADLSGADLSQANLIGADLVLANLIFANLRDADLRDADLRGANLYTADLTNANLDEASLAGANLFHANLTNANLIFADLYGANLFHANLTNANLDEAKIDGTILAREKVSEELQRKNQALTERVRRLEEELEKQKLTQDSIQPSNQGIKASYQWNGFYFRSKTEIKIAEALDRAGVLFYPNNKARLNQAEFRVNKESDFLIFQAGKFGILEVDGRPYHQTAADDHERDRLFKRYGIRVIERFDSKRCWDEPDKVVQEFLELLSQT
jgi:uncharacterized protein YjbI with pentapeptide repeats